jgi:hypothetical protein
VRPNKALEPTPLRVDKIVAILAVGFGLSIFSLFTAARLSARPLGASQGCSSQVDPCDNSA